MDKFQFILLSSLLVVIAYVALLAFKIRQAGREEQKRSPKAAARPGAGDGER